MKRKMELIQQIRALESMPKNRNKMVDWTTTAGHALLSEMSIAEVSVWKIMKYKEMCRPLGNMQTKLHEVAAKC